MRWHATLYSDDAQRMSAYADEVAEQRDGCEPGNAELLRLMMDQFDPSEV